MLKRTKTYFSLILPTCIIAVSVSCGHSTETSDEAVDVKTPVTIAPVEFKAVESTVDLPAVSTFLNKSIIRASTTGTIEKILINQGDVIGSGQLLFTIRTREAMALNNSVGSDSSLSFKGLINITSHNEGVISAISYRKGDFVQEGDELAVVSEQNSLVFILDVPYELEKYIASNKTCTIVLPDNSRINGNIARKLSEMDMQSQTVRYVIKPSDTQHLPGNLISKVNLVKSSNPKALILPKKAVLGNETQTEFWIMKLVNDSIAIKVIVSKGFENNDEVEITDPKLLASDRIVLTGNYGLPDTAKVSIIKE